MGRKKGSRSAGYDERKAELARRVFAAIIDDGNTSLRAMAERAGVSRPTLRHYFGDRDGAVRAALETASEVGRRHRDTLAELPVDNPGDTLRQAFQMLVIGWRQFGVGNIHHVGLKVGLEDPETGATYIRVVMEPTLQSVETLMERMMDAGTVRRADPRHVALTLMSPIFIVLVHQHGLGGDGVRKLDVAAFINDHVDAWCRAFCLTREHPPTDG